MRGRPRKNRTEAEQHDFRLESSKMPHANSRRIAWQKNRAALSRTSSKPPPTLDELREAYGRRNVSCEAMIRLGSMLEDIEAAYCVGYELVPMDDSGTDGSYNTVAHGLPQRFDPTVEDSRYLADGRQLILSSFPINVPVFPVNYDNCHLMNARNEALCRRATGEE